MIQEKTQLLLMRFLDGECGYFERRRVRRLLDSDPEAAQFLAEMQQAIDGCGLLSRVKGPDPVNMWQRVSARIAQEEKAAEFLGRRKISALLPEGFWSFEWLREAWKIYVPSGALALACLALLVVYLNPASRNAGEYVASGRDINGNIVPVNLSLEGATLPGNYIRPRLLEDKYPAPLEVDWLRSRGQVKFIQNSQESSPIIWVDRSRLLAQAKRMRNDPGHAFKILRQQTPVITPLMNE